VGQSFYQGTHDTEWHLPMAASTVMVLPQRAIFFFQRYFLEGITLGSVK